MAEVTISAGGLEFRIEYHNFGGDRGPAVRTGATGFGTPGVDLGLTPWVFLATARRDGCYDNPRSPMADADGAKHLSRAASLSLNLK